MIDINQKMPKDIVLEIAQRVKKRRKELGFTQVQVAERAGMSLASYKRFEQKGLIALQSLVSVSF
ncbi:MAG: helix-turn-helix domain-containing protein, partial [Eggerthellaceae bacterium]